MKLCGRSKMMTQSSRSSSILLALAVSMIVVVVVESSTQLNNTVENVVDTQKDENNTQYHLDIQMNFIDSEIKEDGNEIQETHHPEEPIVIDLGHEFQNTTATTEKVNDTAQIENEVTTVRTDVSIEEVPNAEVQQSQDSTIENVDNLEKTLEAEKENPLEMTTTVPILDETISTLVPIIEKIPNIDNEPVTAKTTAVDAQTQSPVIQQEVSTNKNPEKLHDLSRFFEDEPSRVRPMRGFIKETDNEITASESESDSSSNISKSSESQNSQSSDSSSSQDENKAAEDSSSISEDLSSEKAISPTAPSSGSINEVFIEESTKSAGNDSIEEIEAVTESTGEITNEVTVYANEETHTIMRKPGVDDESPKTSTDGSIQEETNEVTATKPNLQIDPVVHLIVNRQKEELESSSNEVSLTEHDLSDSEKTNLITNKPLEDAVTNSSVTEKIQVPELSEALEKNEDILEDSNSVQFGMETPFDHQDLHQLTEVEKSLKNHPLQNASLNDNHALGLNVIPYAETHDDKTLQTNLLMDDVETSTQAPPIKGKESSVLDGAQEDQPIKEQNGIFKEQELTSSDKSLSNSILVKETFDTSTEKPFDSKIEDPTKTQLEDNQIGTISNSLSHEDAIQTAEDEKLKIEKLNEEPFAGVNSIPSSDNEPPLDNIETSTPGTSINRNEDIQEDQTSKIDNGIFKEAEKAPLSPIDESLPDPRLYEEPLETSTQKSIILNINNPPANTLPEHSQISTTADYARHVDSLQTLRDETSSSVMVSDEIIAPASVGRSINKIIAEGLGKPLPTRSVGDEPSSSSYSSEDKTTTVLVLCAAAGGIFIAFSFAIYLISFQRQNGTLDIEMQEQQCGKDNLDEDDDSETRVSLLNQVPTVDSDEHSSY